MKMRIFSFSYCWHFFAANPGDMTEPAVNVMTQDLSNEQVTTLDEYTEKTLKQMRDIPDFPADQLKVL